MNEQLFFIVLMIAGLCLFVSIPFGMLRMRFKKFSIPWFLMIHAPIPVSIIMRKIYELPFQYALIFLLFSVTGQVIGSTIIKKTVLKSMNMKKLAKLENDTNVVSDENVKKAI